MTTTFDPRSLKAPEIYQLLTRVVAPRPIALVSSLSRDGVGNLAPFSYFNLGGANPPSCVFCPTTTRDTHKKDTLRNIEETGEYTISVVTHAMAERVNQTSWPYAPEIDEFDVVGFGRAPSVRVKPPAVAESPVRLELKLHTIVQHGAGPLSSNYVIGEILLMHVDDAVLTDGLPDNTKIDAISRLGAEWYGRTRPSDLFALPRPTKP